MAKRDPQQQVNPNDLKQAAKELIDLDKAKEVPADPAKPPEASNSQLAATRNITRRLMEMCLQELKEIDKPWQMLSEDAQDDIIHRVRKGCNELTAEVIATVAAGASKSRAIVSLVSVSVKPKVTDIKLQISSSAPEVHNLIGARGEDVVLVMGSDPHDFGVGKDGIEADPQQASI